MAQRTYMHNGEAWTMIVEPFGTGGRIVVLHNEGERWEMSFTTPQQRAAALQEFVRTHPAKSSTTGAASSVSESAQPSGEC